MNTLQMMKGKGYSYPEIMGGELWVFLSVPIGMCCFARQEIHLVKQLSSSWSSLLYLWDISVVKKKNSAYLNCR